MPESWRAMAAPGRKQPLQLPQERQPNDCKLKAWLLIELPVLHLNLRTDLPVNARGNYAHYL